MNFKVTEVLSERTITKSVKRHGVPTTVHKLAATYRLECGHVAKREWPRTRPVVPVGHKLKCHSCSERAELGAEVACG